MVFEIPSAELIGGHFGSRYLRPAKVAKEVVCGTRAADSVAFSGANQGKAVHSHAANGDARAVENGRPRCPKQAAIVPEMSVVKYIHC